MLLKLMTKALTLNAFSTATDETNIYPIFTPAIRYDSVATRLFVS